MIFSNTRVVWW